MVVSADMRLVQTLVVRKAWNLERADFDGPKASLDSLLSNGRLHVMDYMKPGRLNTKGLPGDAKENSFFF